MDDKPTDTNSTNAESDSPIPALGNVTPSASDDIKIEFENSADEMQSRIESQKVKEQKDQQIKVILDRVMWGSCGICLVVIAWVMTVRISGCNQDPTTIVKKEDQPKEKINSKRIKPKSKLDRSLISPLEKEDKQRMAQDKSNRNNGRTKKTKGRQNGQGIGLKKNSSLTSKNGESSPANPTFEPIKETIGFYDFNKPVNKNDLLDGLAPLRLRNVNWSKEPGGGCLRLDPKSRVEVDSEKAFDTIKQLTLLVKFKTDESNRSQCLFSIKGLLVVMLDKKQLKVKADGKLLNLDLSKKLANGKWHQLAVTVGTKSRIWLDGKFAAEGDVSLPEMASSKKVSEVGRLTGSAKSNFVGRLDNIGFYWIELSDSQIKSQFAK